MRLIKIIMLLNMFLLLGCSVVRNKMTFYPDKINVMSTKDIPKHVSELNIETSDKKDIQAFHFNHRSSLDSILVIYFHGNAGNLYGRFEYANKIYDMNKNVLLSSYRGYAKSEGRPTENGIYKDGESVLNFAIDSLGYDEKNIVIIGRSLGSTVAINTAQNRDLKGVILVSPLSSGKEMILSTGLKYLTFIAGRSYNSINKINNLKSPILIIHGTDDEVVPHYMGENIFNTYSGTKKFLSIEKGKHNDLEYVDSVSFWNEIENFIKK